MILLNCIRFVSKLRLNFGACPSYFMSFTSNNCSMYMSRHGDCMEFTAVQSECRQRPWGQMEKVFFVPSVCCSLTVCSPPAWSTETTLPPPHETNGWFNCTTHPLSIWQMICIHLSIYKLYQSNGVWVWQRGAATNCVPAAKLNGIYK